MAICLKKPSLVDLFLNRIRLAVQLYEDEYFF